MLGGGRIQLKTQPNLCMGVVGECRCANPASPRVGVLACNASDPTQRWSLDASTGQIFSGQARTVTSMNELNWKYIVYVVEDSLIFSYRL